jgi:hypothetical protein
MPWSRIHRIRLSVRTLTTRSEIALQRSAEVVDGQPHAVSSIGMEESRTLKSTWRWTVINVLAVISIDIAYSLMTTAHDGDSN